MTPRPRALVTAPLRGPGFDKLRELADVVYDPWIDKNPLRIYTPEQLANRASAEGADVLVVESDSVGGPVFDLPLRAIASTRGDPNNVDIAGATAAGIRFCTRRAAMPTRSPRWPSRCCSRPPGTC